MFFCSFIDNLKLIDCNYFKFLLNSIGTSFAVSDFSDTFVLINKAEKETRKCQRSFGDL